MKERDLVVRISEETGFVQRQVLTVVQKTLDHISEAVAAGATVKLRNFGVFKVKVRTGRIGRNPNRTETDIHIPRRSVVKFKPGKEMREVVLAQSIKDHSKSSDVDNSVPERAAMGKVTVRTWKAAAVLLAEKRKISHEEAQITGAEWSDLNKAFGRLNEKLEGVLKEATSTSNALKRVRTA